MVETAVQTDCTLKAMINYYESHDSDCTYNIMESATWYS